MLLASGRTLAAAWRGARAAKGHTLEPPTERLVSESANHARSTQGAGGSIPSPPIDVVARSPEFADPPHPRAVLHAAGGGHPRARQLPAAGTWARSWWPTSESSPPATTARPPASRTATRAAATAAPIPRATPRAAATTSASACTPSRTRCCRRPSSATRCRARTATRRFGPASAASRSCTRPASAAVRYLNEWTPSDPVEAEAYDALLGELAGRGVVVAPLELPEGLLDLR